MEVEGDNMSLSDAIGATEHLTLRELPAHVHVGPLPLGSVTPSTLPLKELLSYTMSKQTNEIHNIMFIGST